MVICPMYGALCLLVGGNFLSAATTTAPGGLHGQEKRDELDGGGGGMGGAGQVIGVEWVG